MWVQNHIPAPHFDSIQSKIKRLDAHLQLVRLDMNTAQIALIPRLVDDVMVEYAMLIDGHTHRAFFIYITPYEVGAF
jgi:hypothetical protein